MADKPPKKSKRVSMRGMGADAFFGPPAEEKDETPVSQPDSVPVDQQTSETVTQSAVLPVKQQDSILAEQSTNIPASQEAILPVRQEDAMPVTPPTVTPVDQQASTPDKQDLIKATYYIRSDQDIKLEQIRLQRRLKGERIDKSALVREAIDKLIEENS